MLGFLIYIPTLFFVPHYFFIFPFLYLILFVRDANLTININELILFIVVFLMIINNILSLEYADSYKDAFPYCLLMIISVVLAKNLKEKDLTVLLLLITTECIVGILDFCASIGTKVLYYDHWLIYYNRIKGLSDNIAPFAIKIFICFFIIYSIRIKILYKYLLSFILTVALFLSFSRTAIFSTSIMIILVFLKWVDFKNYKKVLLTILFIFISIILYFLYFDILFHQATRGLGVIEITGRDIIWSYYFDFIKNNFISGNGSYKLWLDIPFYGITQAHNSYIQFLATNGIFIFTVMILWIIVNIKKYNVVFILPILVFSFFNYGIFWGISILDIIFYYYLLYFYPKIQ